VDIAKRGGSLKFILSLVIILTMNVCDYLHKGWEFQALECDAYFQLDQEMQNKVYLTQNCFPEEQKDVAGNLVTKLLLAFCSTFVAILMFIDKDGFSRFTNSQHDAFVY